MLGDFLINLAGPNSLLDFIDRKMMRTCATASEDKEHDGDERLHLT